MVTTASSVPVFKPSHASIVIWYSSFSSWSGGVLNVSVPLPRRGMLNAEPSGPPTDQRAAPPLGSMYENVATVPSPFSGKSIVVGP